jgi:hypothetical protein
LNAGKRGPIVAEIPEVGGDTICPHRQNIQKQMNGIEEPSLGRVNDTLQKDTFKSLWGKIKTTHES